MNALPSLSNSERLQQRLRRFGSNDSGVIAIKFAMFLPVILLAAGSSIDHARYLRERTIIQGAVDAGALAAAKELSLTDTKYESLPAIAQAVVARHVEIRTGEAGGTPPSVATAVTRDPIQVEVTATRPFVSAFGDVFGLNLSHVEARAVARIVGKPNICVLGLNARENGTISLEKNARVTGQNCAVYSNSAHNNGLKSKNSANLTATFICTRGGRDGGPGNFNPDPLVDCPSFDDPLLDRPEPTFGPCDPAKPTRITSDAILAPGTYCGLEIANGARVTLRDGIFVIKDKALIVKDGGSLTAESAGLFFIGTSASLTFERGSTISLKAPTTGPMAGLLVFSARSQSETLTHKILSDDARVLIGTIYIPKGELEVDATSPIADQSAYTAIVADKIRLYGGPHLVLNTNYSQTEVPVPDGIKGVGQPVTLER